MKKSTKIWLAILTFIPILFIAFFFVSFFTVLITQIPELENNKGEFPVEFFKSIFGAILFLILAIIIKIGLMIYYIIHASDNIKNDNTKKIMWILILVFIGTIGSVLYYFMEIYPLDDKKLDTNRNVE